MQGTIERSRLPGAARTSPHWKEDAQWRVKYNRSDGKKEQEEGSRHSVQAVGFFAFLPWLCFE